MPDPTPDPIQAVADTAKRLTENIGSATAATNSQAVGNRVASAASTIGIGGTIAWILTFYLKPPEPIHSHVVALIIFVWHTVVFLIGFFWRRRYGE